MLKPNDITGNISFMKSTMVNVAKLFWTPVSWKRKHESRKQILVQTQYSLNVGRWDNENGLTVAFHVVL
jgi:hypothetical protein